MAPPGGRSQINVFATEEPEGPKTVNACQADRNKSSVFGGSEDTSTAKPVQNAPVQETNAQENKPSTKVMAPPGGASSINIFGGPAPQQPSRAPPGGRSSSNIFGGGSNNEPVIGQRALNRRPPGGESHNIFG